MRSSWIKIYFIFYVTLPLICFSQTKYCLLYQKECSFTYDFYKANKPAFDMAAITTGLPSSFLFAIVAPEVSQYSYLRDKLETYSLKVMYVQGGASYGNFSIGYFQMKPSFVERLEEFVRIDTALKTKYGDCLFVNPQDRSARVKRIERLSMLEWQIHYLVIFCEIIKNRFMEVSSLSLENKLHFFAAAYNAGFYKTKKQINKISERSLFPHFSNQKFKYPDLSIFFYQKNEQ